MKATTLSATVLSFSKALSGKSEIRSMLVDSIFLDMETPIAMNGNKGAMHRLPEKARFLFSEDNGAVYRSCQDILQPLVV